ncbi:MAG: FxsA family protein [Rhodothermus sp.]|nr:FxsA family protein [Rhodothermus sp.]
MGARLFLLFLIVPALELALLLQIGRWIGLWPTIGLIFTTALAGSYLARREGLATWRAFQQRLAQGQLPGREIIDGVLILLAGALLITPGVLTDLLGLFGLLPLTRTRIRRYLVHRLQQALYQRATFYISFSGFTPPDNAPPMPPRWSGQPRVRPHYLEDNEP